MIILRPETKRILEVIQYLERSSTAAEIAKTLGVFPSAISGLKKNRTNVGNKLIQKFIKKYNINNNWLFTGEGKMFLDGELSKNSESHVDQSKPQREILFDIIVLKKQVELLQREYDLLSQEMKMIKMVLPNEINKKQGT